MSDLAAELREKNRFFAERGVWHTNTDHSEFWFRDGPGWHAYSLPDPRAMFYLYRWAREEHEILFDMVQLPYTVIVASKSAYSPKKQRMEYAHESVRWGEHPRAECLARYRAIFEAVKKMEGE